MCAARDPRRFNGLCETCCWFGHLSCDGLLQSDRIYSDVPTLSSPPQSNRGGSGYDIPCYPPQQTPPSYSVRSGGPGYDIPCYPPQQTPPSYRGRSGGPGYDIPCYPPQQTPPSYRGRSGGPGYDIPCYPPQQTPPSYNGRSGGPGYDIPCYPSQQTPPSYRGRSGGPGYDIPCYPPQQPAPRPFSSFVRDQRYYGGNSTAPPQQPRPRPFSSFGWEERGACRDEPPVNGLANSIAQGQAQRDVQMDSHGGPVSKVSGPPETTASLARGGPSLQARHHRRLQPPSGTLSPPTVVISDSASEQWLQSDNMEMPMFSPSEGPQQSAPTAVTLAAAAPATEAVTGTRIFLAVSSKGVAEAPASSAGAALAAVPAAAPVVLFSPLRRWGGRPARPLLQME